MVIEKCISSTVNIIIQILYFTEFSSLKKYKIQFNSTINIKYIPLMYEIHY